MSRFVWLWMNTYFFVVGLSVFVLFPANILIPYWASYMNLGLPLVIFGAGYSLVGVVESNRWFSTCLGIGSLLWLPNFLWTEFFSNQFISLHDYRAMVPITIVSLVGGGFLRSYRRDFISTFYDGIKKVGVTLGVVVLTWSLLYFWPLVRGFETYRYRIQSKDVSQRTNAILHLKHFERPETVKLAVGILRSKQYTEAERANAALVLSQFDPQSFDTERIKQTCQRMKQVHLTPRQNHKDLAGNLENAVGRWCSD